jgi:hypothetical protein
MFHLCVNFIPCTIDAGTPTRNENNNCPLLAPVFQIIWPKFRMLGNTVPVKTIGAKEGAV